MSALFQDHLRELRDSFADFDTMQAQPRPGVETEHPRPRSAGMAIDTGANGLPQHFENAWHWASHWIARNGVVLPPDTDELRALRNWFCYQVNMYKKGSLSPRSKELLAHYNIDLSQYRAPRTGRGEMLDDRAMIGRMKLHHAICGSYDLCDDSDADLREWQRRLLECFRSRGTSARLKSIESALPGLRIGMWMAPNETPIGRDQSEWWNNAKAFSDHTREFPAFRGSIDPRTSAAWRNWAHDQIEAVQLGQLSSRQRGELLRLGLLANKDQARSRQRAIAMSAIRNMPNPPQANKRGRVERDLTTFLGSCLLMRMLWRKASATELYSTLSITPAELSRIMGNLAIVKPTLMAMDNLKRLSAIRDIYHVYPYELDQANHELAVPAYVTDHLPKAEQQRLEPLLGMILEVRGIMRTMQVEQDLPALAEATPSERQVLEVA